MLRYLSIALGLGTMMALAVARGAGADIAQPCAGIELAWRCIAQEPRAVATRGPRSDPEVTYLFGQGPEASRMTPAMSEIPLPAGGKVAVIGIGPDAETCCQSSRQMPPIPPNLCPPADVENAKDKNAKDEDAQRGDYALGMSAPKLCPEGAAGHICDAALRLTRAGPPLGQSALPLTVSWQGSGPVQLTVSGPGQCLAVSDRAQFCQIAESDMTRFDIVLRAGISDKTRTGRLCAVLDGPLTGAAQIRLVQTALNTLGFGPLDQDGQSGPATRAAVAAFAAANGLEAREPSDEALLAALGLLPLMDADTDNNQSCVSVTLPARARPPVPVCRAGFRYVAGRGCVRNVDERPPKDDDPPLICDRATTVLSAGQCLCRSAKMERLSPTRCACPAGVECG